MTPERQKALATDLENAANDSRLNMKPAAIMLDSAEYIRKLELELSTQRERIAELEAAAKQLREMFLNDATHTTDCNLYLRPSKGCNCWISIYERLSGPGGKGSMMAPDRYASEHYAAETQAEYPEITEEWKQLRLRAQIVQAWRFGEDSSNRQLDVIRTAFDLADGFVITGSAVVDGKIVLLGSIPGVSLGENDAR